MFDRIINQLTKADTTVTGYRRNHAPSDADLLSLIEVNGVTEIANAAGLPFPVNVHEANPPNPASLFPLKHAPVFLLFRLPWHRNSSGAE
jgi:hypothetical protein